MEDVLQSMKKSRYYYNYNAATSTYLLFSPLSSLLESFTVVLENRIIFSVKSESGLSIAPPPLILKKCFF